jgi:hypothetical protein
MRKNDSADQCLAPADIFPLDYIPEPYYLSAVFPRFEKDGISSASNHNRNDQDSYQPEPRGPDRMDRRAFFHQIQGLGQHQYKMA